MRYYTTPFDKNEISLYNRGTSIFTPLWNRGGGSKKASPLEMCYLGPNKAISIIKLLLASKSHGSMNMDTLNCTKVAMFQRRIEVRRAPTRCRCGALFSM